MMAFDTEIYFEPIRKRHQFVNWLTFAVFFLQHICIFFLHSNKDIVAHFLHCKCIREKCRFFGLYRTILFLYHSGLSSIILTFWIQLFSNRSPLIYITVPGKRLPDQIYMNFHRNCCFPYHWTAYLINNQIEREKISFVPCVWITFAGKCTMYRGKKCMHST